MNRSALLTSALNLLQLTRRIPFTLATLSILALAGAFTNTHLEALSRHWLNHLGYSAQDLILFRWERLISSALVTDGGRIFWQAMFMVAITAGAVELSAGTKWAAISFWGVHLAALLSLSLLIVLPLHWSGQTLGTALVISRDVGPSAGYFGSLGTAITYLRKPYNWLAGATIWFVLIVVVFLPIQPGRDPVVTLSANLVHLLAFPLGWILGRWYHQHAIHQSKQIDKPHLATLRINTTPPEP